MSEQRAGNPATDEDEEASSAEVIFWCTLFVIIIVISCHHVAQKQTESICHLVAAHADAEANLELQLSNPEPLFVSQAEEIGLKLAGRLELVFEDQKLYRKFEPTNIQYQADGSGNFKLILGDHCTRVIMEFVKDLDKRVYSLSGLQFATKLPSGTAECRMNLFGGSASFGVKPGEEFVANHTLGYLCSMKERVFLDEYVLEQIRLLMDYFEIKVEPINM